MSAPTMLSGRLLHSPVLRLDGQWWLVSGAGAVAATDSSFTGELDAFAVALAAADQAVAALRSQQGPAALDGGGRP
jgi:hypothetical protein